MEHRKINGEARARLLDGKLLPMIACLLLSVCAAVAPMLLLASLFGALAVAAMSELIYGMWMLLMFGGMAVVLILWSLPMLYAPYRMAYCLWRDEPIHVSDALLWVLCGGRYLSFVCCGFFSLLRVLTVAGVTVGGIMTAFASVSQNGTGLFGILFFGALTVLAALGTLWLTCGIYYLPYGLCRGMSLREAIRYSRARVAGNRTQLLSGTLHSLPLWLLSFISVGVLLMIYAAPRMLFSYMLLSEESGQEILQEKER